MRTQIAATLAIALAFGCTDQATTPTELSDGAVATTSGPAFNIANAPNVSGMIVTRGETPFGVSWADPKDGTRVTIGFDPRVECQRPRDNEDLVAVQFVWLPEGRPLLLLVQGDDMQTRVWPFADFNCDLFATVEPLATGVSDLVYADNDRDGPGPGNKNANGFAFTAHGALTRPSGADANFSGHWNGNLSTSLVWRMSRKISLH